VASSNLQQRKNGQQQHAHKDNLTSSQQPQVSNCLYKNKLIKIKKKNINTSRLSVLMLREVAVESY
jgi:hypothetical protein